MSEKFDLESELRELAESKELLKAVSDIDYSKHVVDGISEETGIAKWKVKLAYKALAPLIGCMAEGTGKLLADGMKQKLLSIAARIPWTEKVVKAIKDMTTKTTQEIQSKNKAKEYLNQIRSTDQAALDFRKELSLEFNAALDTYTATLEMRAEFGDSLNCIREDLSRIEDFVNPQPRFKQPIKQSQRNRFVYRSDFIPFVGRTAELEKLHNFLWSDALFCWQAITAPGGVGKSRLAWEFCQRSSVVWRAGFVENLQTEKTTLASWQPKQPTLLVIDYASKDREEVKGILKTLSERSDLDCAVRVLLLDRDSSDEWLKEGWPGSDGHAVEDCRYQEPWPLETTLGEDASKEILCFFLGSGQSVSDTELQGHLNTLKGIDPKNRPIFAAFYADAVVREGIGRRWDMESLIRDVIEREKDQYWKRNGVRFVTGKDEAMLAFASMTGGLRSTHTDLPPQVTPISELLEHPERFDALGGYTEEDEEGEAVQIIPAWEPDLVGELFVLDLLKNNKTTKSNSLRKHLLSFSWNFNQKQTVSFINRIIQDYPSHSNTNNMLLPPTSNDQKRMWMYLGMYMSNWPASREKETLAETIYIHSKTIFDTDPKSKFLAINFTKTAHEYLKICISNNSYEKIKTIGRDTTTTYIVHHDFEVIAAMFAQTLYTRILYSTSQHLSDDADTSYALMRSLHSKFPDNIEIATLQAKSIMEIIGIITDSRYIIQRVLEIKKLRTEFKNDEQIASISASVINATDKLIQHEPQRFLN